MSVQFSNKTTNAFWHLDLAAAQGEILRVGSYESVARYPFNQSQPGLSLILDPSSASSTRAYADHGMSG